MGQGGPGGGGGGGGRTYGRTYSHTPPGVEVSVPSRGRCPIPTPLIHPFLKDGAVGTAVQIMLFVFVLLIHDTRRTKKSIFFTRQKNHSKSIFRVLSNGTNGRLVAQAVSEL